MKRTAEEQKPRYLSFSSKSEWSTESKAFDKSKNAAVTTFFHQGSVLQFLSEKQKHQLLKNFLLNPNCAVDRGCILI